MFDKDLFTGIFKAYCCWRDTNNQHGKKGQAAGDEKRGYCLFLTYKLYGIVSSEMRPWVKPIHQVLNLFIKSASLFNKFPVISTNYRTRSIIISGFDKAVKPYFSYKP